MKKKKRMWLKDTYPLPLLKIFVYLILIATFCIFSIQIYDRYMFHEQVKEIAIKETKKRCNNAVIVTSDSVKKLAEKHVCKEFLFSLTSLIILLIEIMIQMKSHY